MLNACGVWRQVLHRSFAQAWVKKAEKDAEEVSYQSSPSHPNSVPYNLHDLTPPPSHISAFQSPPHSIRPSVPTSRYTWFGFRHRRAASLREVDGQRDT